MRFYRETPWQRAGYRRDTADRLETAKCGGIELACENVSRVKVIVTQGFVRWPQICILKGDAKRNEDPKKHPEGFPERLVK